MTKTEFDNYIENETFNVYDLDYPKDFIQSLPIDFYRIKNMDLTNVPKIYHVVFRTDWNWGNHSKMGNKDRVLCNTLFLEYNNFCILTKILKKYNINTNGMDIYKMKSEYKKIKDDEKK
jgi:hypothetical protein